MTAIDAGSPAQAPLDITEYEAVWSDDLSAARALPAEAYTSADVLEWEKQYLFGSAWACVGRVDGLAKRGDQRAVSIGGRGVVLARGTDGALRGFRNSCRHRGHELLVADSCTTNRRIVCPYHAWVFDLDGTLRSATRFTGDELDPADWSLLPVRVEEWYGWVFVALSPTPPPLAEWMGNLTDVLSPWNPTDLVIGGQHTYEVDANWKTIVENYAECYHCPSIHPELCTVSSTESAKAFTSTGYWIGGPLDLLPHAESVSMSGRGGTRLPGVGDEHARAIHYFVLAPSLLIAAHPDYVMTHRLDPIGQDRTRVECTWLFPPDVAAAPGFDPSGALEIWDRTNRQDFNACESVTRGLRSGGFRAGVFDERESVVRAFQEQVARVYATGVWSKPRS